MNPIRIFLGLVQALSAATAAFLEPFAAQLDSEAQGSQGGSQGQGENQAQAPVPFAGETSEAFAQRWPAGLAAPIIGINMVWDPWRQPDQGPVFVGAWIPVEAAFSLPPV